MINLTKKIDLEDYTLIIPSVAIGNVGQLSIDLLISSLNLERIGQVLNTSFIPLVGLNPFDEKSDELCTAVDLYAEKTKKVVAIQIRSPLVYRFKEFFCQIQTFVTEHKISKVIILTSSYAHEKYHHQFKTVELRYMASPNLVEKYEQFFKDKKWIENKPIETNQGERAQIPGGGFALQLFNFLTNSNIPCAVLFKFCSEGDNIPDALDLITYLNQWLTLFELDDSGNVKVKYPPSWEYLFGNPPSLEIY